MKMQYRDFCMLLLQVYEWHMKHWSVNTEWCNSLRLTARWVPKHLTPKLKERLMDICETLLWCYETEGYRFLKPIVSLVIVGFTTSICRPSEPARSGDIHHRQDPRSSIQLCLRVKWCSLSSGTVKPAIWHAKEALCDQHIILWSAWESFETCNWPKQYHCTLEAW